MCTYELYDPCARFFNLRLTKSMATTTSNNNNNKTHATNFNIKMVTLLKGIEKANVNFNIPTKNNTRTQTQSHAHE